MNLLMEDVQEKLRSFEEPIVTGIISRQYLKPTKPIEIMLDDEDNHTHPFTCISVDIDNIIMEYYLNKWLPLITGEKGNQTTIQDQLLLELIACRIYYGKELAELKYQKTPNIFLEYHNRDYPLESLVENPEIEHKVIKRVRLAEKNHSNSKSKVVELIFSDIIDLNKRVQVIYLIKKIEGLRVGYLGPDGTYASQVSRHYFNKGTNLLPHHTHDDLFVRLDEDELDMIVIPVKNSSTGVIIEVDLDRYIPIKMVDFNVVIDLLAPIGGRLGEIKEVYSHPQAYIEAKPWLDIYLPDVQFIPTESTISASIKVSEIGDFTKASLSTHKCAEKLKLSTIAEKIAGSMTSFYILKRR